jgi:myo-inositol-1-phosphate synthase
MEQLVMDKERYSEEWKAVVTRLMADLGMKYREVEMATDKAVVASTVHGWVKYGTKAKIEVVYEFYDALVRAGLITDERKIADLREARYPVPEEWIPKPPQPQNLEEAIEFDLRVYGNSLSEKGKGQILDYIRKIEAEESRE